jgi:hypothetical protein
MAKLELIVGDPASAKVALRDMYVNFPKLQDVVDAQPAPAVGTLWAECESTCPDKLPNCENCGDPAFAETCKKNGHCPHCGTRHGVAPLSVLARKGLVKREVVADPSGEVIGQTVKGK